MPILSYTQLNYYCIPSPLTYSFSLYDSPHSQGISFLSRLWSKIDNHPCPASLIVYFRTHSFTHKYSQSDVPLSLYAYEYLKNTFIVKKINNSKIQLLFLPYKKKNEPEKRTVLKSNSCSFVSKRKTCQGPVPYLAGSTVPDSVFRHDGT